MRAIAYLCIESVIKICPMHYKVIANTGNLWPSSYIKEAKTVTLPHLTISPALTFIFQCIQSTSPNLKHNPIPLLIQNTFVLCTWYE